MPEFVVCLFIIRYEFGGKIIYGQLCFVYFFVISLSATSIFIGKYDFVI
jgi:hypothetical protein